MNPVFAQFLKDNLAFVIIACIAAAGAIAAGVIMALTARKAKAGGGFFVGGKRLIPARKGAHERCRQFLSIVGNGKEVVILVQYNEHVERGVRSDGAHRTPFRDDGAANFFARSSASAR